MTFSFMNSNRAPTKQSINLATVGIKRTNWTVMLIALEIVVVIAVLFGKFLVFDRFAAVSAAEREVNIAQMELDACNLRNATYGELNDIYAHYTYSGMTEEELSLVDRTEVLDLIRRVIAPRSEVREWSLTGNLLTIMIEGATLQEINTTAQKLLADDLVSFCEVNTATTDELSAYHSILASNDGMVTANIVAHLLQQGGDVS